MEHRQKNKKIRILGLLTHFKLERNKEGKEICYPGPVDFYRVIQQLKYLPKDEFEVYITYEAFGEGSKHKTIDEVMESYDIIFFSYMDAVAPYLELRVRGLKKGIKIAIDIDDNIWAVDPTHPYYKGDFEPGSEKNFNRSAILLDADTIVTTSLFLRSVLNKKIKRPTSEIDIIPNFIDLEEFDHKRIKDTRDKSKFTIGYVGGSSHLPDLIKPEFVKALHIVMSKYPQVVFKCSPFLPQLRAEFGNRFEYYIAGTGEKYRREEWPKLMGSFDVCVAPLVNTDYSKSKSYLKYLEYSAGKKPSICEEIEPYNEILKGSKGRGFLAHTTEDWVRHLTYFIENPKEIDIVGNNAYEYVKKHNTIQNPKNIESIARVFRRLFDKEPKKL